MIGKILKYAVHMVRHEGIFAFAKFAGRKVLHLIHPPRCRCVDEARSLTLGKRGLEIGGPSRIFSAGGRLPVYDVAGRIDGCNFAETTIWADGLGEDKPYAFGPKVLGRQYQKEGTRLDGIPAGSYDFVLSSHAIEHIANPLRALREWVRVLRDGGALILVMPHKDGTFDHRRPVTALEHIEEDEKRDIGEDDMTHVGEIIALHDFARDPGAGSPEEFRIRCENNLENRGIHHHVFDTELAVKLVDCMGLRIVAVEPSWPYDIVIVCVNPAPGEAVDNSALLGGAAAWRSGSPFPSDRATGS